MKQMYLFYQCHQLFFKVLFAAKDPPLLIGFQFEKPVFYCSILFLFTSSFVKTNEEVNKSNIWYFDPNKPFGKLF